MNEKEKNAWGADKVNRYGWTMKDMPGRLEWIDKRLIRVDKSYQRDLKSTKVLAIVKDWSWVAYGTITVAIRNGEYYAIDGQHRVDAAMNRSDVKEIPCIVFETKDNVQEAEGFLTTQTRRKAVTMVEKFKALVLIKDEHALLVQRLIERSGRQVTSGGNGSNHINCLSLLMTWAKKNPTVLVRMWDTCCDVCSGFLLHGKMVSGLLYIEANLPEGVSLTQPHWRRRLMSVGYEKLIEGAHKAAAFYAEGGEKVWAIGMVQAINYKARHKLELKELKAENK